jgi:hypothetical protein
MEKTERAYIQITFVVTVHNQVPSHLRPIFKFLHENFIFYKNSCTVVCSSILATTLLIFVILGIVFASL